MNQPPPVPPSAPSAASAPAAPPRKGLSGCAIAAIIGAALVVVAIPVIGILAAIAIPQYQEYIVRSRVYLGYAVVEGLQPKVDAWREAHGACPGNVDLGQPEDFHVPLSHGEPSREAVVTVGSVEDGACAIEMRLQGLNPAVDGKTLVAVSDGAGWRCDAGTLDARYLPPPCRTAGATRP